MTSFVSLPSLLRLLYSLLPTGRKSERQRRKHFKPHRQKPG